MLRTAWRRLPCSATYPALPHVAVTGVRGRHVAALPAHSVPHMSVALVHGGYGTHAQLSRMPWPTGQ